MPNETARTAPTQRDMHLQLIAERGRMAWQKASGYNRRALVEADISRYKRVIGDALRSDTDDRQATEVAIAVGVLNRMLEPGRPKSVRITEERPFKTGLRRCRHPSNKVAPVRKAGRFWRVPPAGAH
jgi:hypothetical protein